MWNGEFVCQSVMESSVQSLPGDSKQSSLVLDEGYLVPEELEQDFVSNQDPVPTKHTTTILVRVGYFPHPVINKSFIATLRDH
jgi:hypothetical protein